MYIVPFNIFDVRCSQGYIKNKKYKWKIIIFTQTGIIYSDSPVKVVEEVHVLGHVFRRFVQTPLPISQLEFVIKI